MRASQACKRRLHDHNKEPYSLVDMLLYFSFIFKRSWIGLKPNSILYVDIEASAARSQRFSLTFIC